MATLIFIGEYVDIVYANDFIVKWHKLVKKSIYKCRENEIVDLWLFDTKLCWEVYGKKIAKKKKKRGGGGGC
jgi:hypothetical protein